MHILRYGYYVLLEHGRRVQGGDRNRELGGVVNGAIEFAEDAFPQPDRSAPRCRRYSMQTHRR